MTHSSHAVIIWVAKLAEQGLGVNSLSWYYKFSLLHDRPTVLASSAPVYRSYVPVITVCHEVTVQYCYMEAKQQNQQIWRQEPTWKKICGMNPKINTVPSDVALDGANHGIYLVQGRSKCCSAQALHLTRQNPEIGWHTQDKVWHLIDLMF